MSDDLEKRLRGLSRGEHSDHTIGEEAADELARLRAENARLHTRLEDNFCFDAKGNRNDVEPGSIPDGIECRDETIRVQDAEIAALRHDIERQVKAASDLAGECERLRRALRRIAITDDADCLIVGDARSMTLIARAALKEGAAK